MTGTPLFGMKRAGIPVMRRDGFPAAGLRQPLAPSPRSSATEPTDKEPTDKETDRRFAEASEAKVHAT